MQLPTRFFAQTRNPAAIPQARHVPEETGWQEIGWIWVLIFLVAVGLLAWYIYRRRNVCQRDVCAPDVTKKLYTERGISRENFEEISKRKGKSKKQAQESQQEQEEEPKE